MPCISEHDQDVFSEPILIGKRISKYRAIVVSLYLNWSNIISFSIFVLFGISGEIFRLLFFKMDMGKIRCPIGTIPCTLCYMMALWMNTCVCIAISRLDFQKSPQIIGVCVQFSLSVDGSQTILAPASEERTSSSPSPFIFIKTMLAR